LVESAGVDGLGAKFLKERERDNRTTWAHAGAARFRLAGHLLEVRERCRRRRFWRRRPFTMDTA